MGHQEQGVPSTAPVVVGVVPPVAQRADGIKAAVSKAGPVTGLAGRLGKGDGEPPKDPPKTGEPPKDPPKGEDPPKEPEKKDPPKDPKLGRIGRLDRMGRVLADKDVATPPKPPKGLADGSLVQDRVGRL
ncbi:hypothetical protein [Knoellia flava]|uniref:Uncharacterized protein n=1 Tax=Knoellia flava TaxID=913969 RepID=A0A8H9FVF7_9MICO|nr:hypothetical protein [Knoellia flava]GGB86067.1 hypothetical protein GCM10011314_27290 [Knoellia flava]